MRTTRKRDRGENRTSEKDCEGAAGVGEGEEKHGQSTVRQGTETSLEIARSDQLGFWVMYEFPSSYSLVRETPEPPSSVSSPTVGNLRTFNMPGSSIVQIGTNSMESSRLLLPVLMKSSAVAFQVVAVVSL